MKKNLLIVVLSLMSTLFACEKEITFRGDQTASLLTLNSLILPDSAICITLFKSRFFLSDDGFVIVRNADVRLFKDDILVETLHAADDLRYYSDYRPQIGDRLRITAAVAGMEPIECSTEILPTPRIVAVELTPIAPTGDYTPDHAVYDLHLTLNDPVATSDYYRIDLYATLYDAATGETNEQDIYFHSDDLIFGTTTGNDDFFSENDNYYSAFSDELFNGKEYKFKLRIPYITRYDPLLHPTLHVELQHITKDYYLYLRSRDAAGSIGNLGGIFSEPAQIYNNIRGGIGILGSYTPFVYPIPL
jgi:hypothetical protein